MESCQQRRVAGWSGALTTQMRYVLLIVGVFVLIFFGADLLSFAQNWKGGL